MSDILAPLREPEPASGLPPEEVRRRGDRRRRRRTGLVVVGTACATALVVGGTVLLTGGPPDSRSGPEPVAPPSARAAIPAELDLADGLARAGVEVGDQAPPLEICDVAWSVDDRATASRRAGDRNGPDLTTRVLAVYADVATTRSVVADLLAAFDDCPRFSDGRVLEWTTTVRPTAYGDQGWVFTRYARGTGSRTPLGESIQVVRVGSSLLVLQRREGHGLAPEALRRGTGIEVAVLLRHQMCLLTDDGCAWRSDPDILRPDGWGRWTLGMTLDELEAVGATGLRDSGACTALDLGSGEGLLTEVGGLVSIDVPEGVRTPDGIGLGSSRDDVLERYWYGDRVDGVVRVRASPTTDFEITVRGGQVVRMALTTRGVDCSG